MATAYMLNYGDLGANMRSTGPRIESSRKNLPAGHHLALRLTADILRLGASGYSDVVYVAGEAWVVNLNVTRCAQSEDGRSQDALTSPR